MDDKFLIGLYPGKHRVLGVTLPAFSFWHLLGLHAIHSPFVDADGVLTLRDLQIAIKICQTRYPDQPRIKVTLRDVILHKLRAGKEAYVRAQCEAFLFYKQCHETLPAFWENENEVIPREITAPVILARVSNLMAKTNMGHAEIWNDLSPGYACWLSSTLGELEGADVRFEREEDLLEDDDDLPDLTKLNEAELYEVVKADRGEEWADAWLIRRRANPVNATSQSGSDNRPCGVAPWE